MSKDFLMVKQIDFVIIVGKIKTLGIAVSTGIAAIFLFGLLVTSNNNLENFDIINLISFILVFILIPFAFILKNLLLKKVNLENFMTAYFNAHIIPYAIIDFAALFCITTNLFVNEKIIFASVGFLISIAAMILLFPKESDFYKLKSKI